MARTWLRLALEVEQFQQKNQRPEAGQAYTADRHRPVTTEHGRLLERSRVVAPHFDNAFLLLALLAFVAGALFMVAWRYL
jgi:hypothetical protein